MTEKSKGNDDEYLQQLGEFIEKNHKKLERYAQYYAPRKYEHMANDILHNIIVDLYDGVRARIDFAKGPLAVFQLMIRSQWAGFHSNLATRATKRSEQPEEVHLKYDDGALGQIENNDVINRALNTMPDTKSKKYLIMFLQGYTSPEIKDMIGKGACLHTVEAELWRMKRLLMKTATALLQADSSSDRVHPL